MASLGASSKCNDATTLWSCSYDKTQAYRCFGPAVVVERCDGSGACEVKPEGQDDVCNLGPRPSGTGPVGPSAPTPPPQTNGTKASEAPREQTESVDASSEGCSVVSRRGAGGSLGLIVLAAGLAAARRRRRARS